MAEWADKSNSFKIVNVNIVAETSDDFLQKLTFSIANMHYNIVALETKNLSDKTICNLKIKIDNFGNLNKIETEIKKIKNILEVKVK